jgi:hypothetical protein
MAVAMKNAIFWGFMLCGSCKNRRFEEIIASIIGVTRIRELGTSFLRSMLWMLVNANVVPSYTILVTLMMEALCSSETSVLTRTTRRNIPVDGILHMNRKYTLIETHHVNARMIHIYKNLIKLHSMSGKGKRSRKYYLLLAHTS